MKRARTLMVLALTSCLPACSGEATTVPAGNGPALSALLRSTRVSPPRHGAALYVSDRVAGVVWVYPATGKDPKPIRSISQGIDGPIGVAVDGAGTLYVANSGNNTVTEYPAGTSAPSVTLSDGLSTPVAIAVDAAGTVYVTSGAVKNAYVLEFPKGATSPSAQVGKFGLPAGIALDAAGNLYVADAFITEGEFAVWEIAKGSTQQVNLQLADLQDPSGIAVDPSGDLYVSNNVNSAGFLLGFHPGDVNPFVTIAKGLDAPNGLAIENDGTIFVTNGGGNPSGSIGAYKPNHSKPYTGYSGNGLADPFGVAVYPPSPG